MDEEQVKCEQTVDGAENGGSNNPKADDAQKESYMEERKAEKEQIVLSFCYDTSFKRERLKPWEMLCPI